MKKLNFVAALLLVLASAAFVINPKAHAASRTITTDVNWSESSCVGSMSSPYGYALDGDSVTLSLTNQSSFAMSLTVQSATYGNQLYSLNANDSLNVQLNNMTGNYTVTANPVGSSCGSKVPGVMRLYPGKGQLTCTLTTDPPATNPIWQLGISGSTIAPSNSLYSASGIWLMPAWTGSSTTQQTGARDSSETFSFYNGPNSTYPLLASVTCPGAGGSGGTVGKDEGPIATSKVSTSSGTTTTGTSTPANSTSTSTTSSATPTHNVQTKNKSTTPAQHVSLAHRSAVIGTWLAVVVVVLALWQVFGGRYKPSLALAALGRGSKGSKTTLKKATGVHLKATRRGLTVKKSHRRK